jgi:hypothetical protein
MQERHQLLQKALTLMFIIFGLLTSSKSGRSLASRDINAPTENVPYYLPWVVRVYASPPQATVSHYISWDNTGLACPNFYSMGQALGQSIPSGFNR